MFICSYPPKWLIKPLSPPSFMVSWAKPVTVPPSKELDCLLSLTHIVLRWKICRTSANILSIQRTFNFRRGRRVLCNFVWRKTNTRVRCKLSVNWWRAGRVPAQQLWRQSSTLSSPCLSLSVVWSNVDRARRWVPSVHVNARRGGSAPRDGRARMMTLIYDIWW